jgi:hypothetical protein
MSEVINNFVWAILELDFALAWWVILVILPIWLDKYINVPVCFITYGRTNIIYFRQLDNRVVLKRLLETEGYFD